MLMNTVLDMPIQPVIDVLSPHFLGLTPTVVARYDGSEDIDMPGLITIKKNGTRGFKIWVRGSCSIRFTNVKKGTLIEGCLVGHGGCGQDPQITDTGDGGYNNIGGDGGNGGQIRNIGTIEIWPTFWIDCFLEHDTYIGYGKAGIGANTGTGVVGGTGGSVSKSADMVVDGIPMPGAVSETSPTAGADGHYAFYPEDSTFDGIKYGAGGGGARAYPNSGYAADGNTPNAPGSGGHGRSSFEEELEDGQKGIILFRYSANPVNPSSGTHVATLKYNSSGGGTYADQTATGSFGGVHTFTISSTAPNKGSDYTFMWWAGSDGKKYQPGGSVKVHYDGTVTLTAIFEYTPQYTYYIGYSGGSGCPAWQYALTTDKSRLFILSSTEPTLDGHVFLNWKGQDNKSYSPGDSVTLTPSFPHLLLEAQWAEEINPSEITVPGEIDPEFPELEETT